MPVAARILFLALFLPLLIAVNVFLYRRLVRDVTESRAVRRLAVIFMAAGLFVIPILRLFLRGVMLPRPISLAMMTWWGFQLAALFTLLAFEIGLRVVKRSDARKRGPDVAEDPARRMLLARTAASAATAISASVVGYGMKRAFEKPELTEVQVKLPGLPKALDGFVIVQLSDIHVGSIIQEAFLDQLVESANSAKPDLLAITGDLVDGQPDQIGQYIARFRNLKSRYGTHFVSGNHDWSAGWDEWARVLRGMDFRVLRNERVVIGDNAASFDLLGVDDWHSQRSSEGYNLSAATAGRDGSRASVLMAHQPTNFEAVNAAGIGLQLSGHTHGGQLFPGTLVGDLIWGAQNAGLSRVGTTIQYTSRGCGFVGPPMRIGAPPEVVKLVLVA